MYDIVMAPSDGECWLKNANDEIEIDNFIKRWNGKNFKESKLYCEKKEDELELCSRFQFGKCDKSDDKCNWDHIPCTVQGNCPSTCPYGHDLGVKSEHESQISKSNRLDLHL